MTGVWCTCTLLAIVTGVLAAADDYCSLAQFSCMNGKCIPSQWQCDEDDDCNDTSDELNCAPRSCNEAEEFRCASGQCIPARWQCDGDPDCSDGSDEAEDRCFRIECRSDHFSCGVAKACIPSTWLCDGHEDCLNGRDESPESCGNGSCKPDEFMCVNSKRCITARWVCDRDSDCEDGSDEANCEATNCTSSQWQCDNKQCIPAFWRCDSETDCHDSSDERNCLQSNSGSSRTCSENEFQCNMTGDCINKDWRCDQDEDCTDGSDEVGCKPRSCKADEYLCSDDNRCIPLHNVCNGISDCGNGSDEKTCTETTLCDLPKMFDCTGGSRGHCISWNLVCNHHNDCLGMEDEAPELCVNKTNPCSIDNGGCAHECIFTYVSHFCTCHQGYQLASDGRQCEDVDECQMPETCTQICENKKGGYKCGCRSGYEWDPAEQGCRALGEEPFLLFANRHDLREIRIYSGNYQMLVDGLKSVIALDFDFSEKLLFWSDVALETISMTRLTGNRSLAVEVLVNQDVATPDGLAFDWIHKNLYWTDTGNNRIDVLALAMGGAAAGGRAMRKTLFNVNLDEPRAIVVDPRDDQRFLYWTDWGHQPKIERSYLDGTSRTGLLSRDLQWPNGLTIDYESNTLFWVDAKLHHIACSDLQGNNQRIVLSSYQHLKHPFAIAVFEDHVYWTDWETGSIFKAHKFGYKKGRSPIKNVAMQLFTPMDIHVYHKLTQPHATNACSNSNCSHICLPRPARLGGYSCLCPDHDATRYVLDDSRTNCIPVVDKTRGDATLLSTPATTPESTKVHRQTTTKAGHIAGVVVAILLIIAIVMIVVGVIAYRCYVGRTVRTLNFDNPVYRKTTEDHLSLEKHQYQPSRTLPPTLEPLTSADRECV